MFRECKNLKSIKVAFADWKEWTAATEDWVYGVNSEGTFECPESLEIKYGDSNIPASWSVVNSDNAIAS